MELLTTIAAQAFPFLDAIFDLGNEILGNDAAISPAKGKTVDILIVDVSDAFFFHI